jgi:hypothetical protein
MSEAELRRNHVHRHHEKAQERQKEKHGRPAWNFFAPQQTSNKVALSSDSEGRSCFLLRLAKEQHHQPIASSKSLAAPLWGTQKADIATRAAAGPTPVPQPAAVSPSRTSADTLSQIFTGHRVRVPSMDLMSAAERRQWAVQCAKQAAFIKKNEASLEKRRLADRSFATLDNAYRQFIAHGNKPLMNEIMTGAFTESTRHVQKRQDYIGVNRRQVRSASAVVHQCRQRGLFS